MNKIIFFSDVTQTPPILNDAFET
ncbi:unnamed protein product, partial [Rotaria socialis]